MIYFIQSGPGGAIKIGHAHNPDARMRDLQISTPHELRMLVKIEGGWLLEKFLHRKFAGLRVRGEWFEAHADLLEFIANRKVEKPSRYRNLKRDLESPARPFKGHRRLTFHEVVEIILACNGGETRASVARRYQITPYTASSIATGKCHRHISNRTWIKERNKSVVTIKPESLKKYQDDLANSAHTVGRQIMVEPPQK